MTFNLAFLAIGNSVVAFRECKFHSDGVRGPGTVWYGRRVLNLLLAPYLVLARDCYPEVRKYNFRSVSLSFELANFRPDQKLYFRPFG